MQDPAGRLRAAISSLILTAYVAGFLVPALAAAQGAGTSKLQKGQEYYEQSRFDDAIKLLKDLTGPGGGLAGENLQRARELLARSYVKKGDPAQGKQVFKEILRTTPNWRPDAVHVPPDEIAVFEQALTEFTQEAAPPTEAPTSTPEPPAPPPPPKSEGRPEKTGVKSKKVWYLVGGGVLVAGIFALAAGGGKKDSGPTSDPALAGFPNPPTP